MTEFNNIYLSCPQITDLHSINMKNIMLIKYNNIHENFSILIGYKRSTILSIYMQCQQRNTVPKNTCLHGSEHEFASVHFFMYINVYYQ